SRSFIALDSENGTFFECDGLKHYDLGPDDPDRSVIFGDPPVNRFPLPPKQFSLNHQLGNSSHRHQSHRPTPMSPSNSHANLLRPLPSVTCTKPLLQPVVVSASSSRNQSLKSL